MTIEEAVNISVNRFLTEDIFSEKKPKPTESKGNKDNTIHKGVIKKKNGQRGNFDYDKDKKSNPNVTAGDQSALAKVLKTGALDVAEIAQKVYPDHTREGAQSQLRKKIEGEKSDSGSQYKLNQGEAKRLRKVLNQLGFI